MLFWLLFKTETQQIDRKDNALDFTDLIKKRKNKQSITTCKFKIIWCKQNNTNNFISSSKKSINIQTNQNKPNSKPIKIHKQLFQEPSNPHQILKDWMKKLTRLFVYGIWNELKWVEMKRSRFWLLLWWEKKRMKMKMKLMK